MNEPPDRSPMRRLLFCALVFAIGACGPLLVADAVWGTGLHGVPFPVRLANMHWLFHAGTLTLSVAGVVVALATLGGKGPPYTIAFGLGIAFGLVSIVAAPAALVIGGVEWCAFWQFIGASFVAVGASPFTRDKDETPPLL